MTSKRASIVTVDDTIRVEHRNDLEYEVVPEGLRFRRIADQELDDALHHPTRIGLTWVHTRRYEDAFLGLIFVALRVLVLRRYRDVLAPVTS